MKFNKYQTDIGYLEEEDPKAFKLIKEAINTIPFMRFVLSDDSVRGYAKDRPKKDGKIVVDVTKPHLLENIDFFRERALFYEKYGKYTNIFPSKNPFSDYAKFWREEKRRFKEGLVRESDGEWISGYNYFYWNYSPIWQMVKTGKTTSLGKSKGERERKFPKPYLGDYLFFHYFDQAREAGMHTKMLKSRGIGMSFKAGALGPCNMIIYPGTGNPNFYLASDKTFLSGDKGVFGKVVDTLDWLAATTPFPKMRLVNSLRSMEIQLGYLDAQGNRQGALSSVYGISLKDNPSKVRGIRGPMIFYEEDGLFPNLETAWNVNRPGMEAGSVATGIMFAGGTGGCLTADNQVFTVNGELKYIKDLTISDGIIGCKKGEGFSKEKVTWMQPPSKKECVKITTNTRRVIECSKDHPILTQGKATRSDGYISKFKEASSLEIGSKIATIEEVDIWSDKELEHARVIGWLIGDGTYGHNQTVRLANCEPEINSYMEEHYDCKTNVEYTTKLGKTYKEMRIKGFTKVLRGIGIFGQTKLAKRLPDRLTSYSKESVCEVIGGLFDTDGYVSYRPKPERNSAIMEVSLSQVGEKILLDTQLVLQKLGIHSSLRKRMPRENNPLDKNPWYELCIRDANSLINFYENIPLKVAEKQSRMELIYKRSSSIKRKLYNGVRFERVTSVEDIGIQDVYNLTAGNTNTYIGNGIVTHNTEGASFEGSKKLFYSPRAYNIYGIPNFYDKNSQGLEECGFFWGAYLNREDCNYPVGEPDVTKALVEIMTERAHILKASNDPKAITQKKAEHPLTPEEAIMRTGGNMFPVADISEYLININANREQFLSSHYIGKLVYGAAGQVKWLPDPEAFPIRGLDTGSNKKGAIEIFEMPKFVSDGKIQSGRYIAGIDPIDQDEGSSLFSVTVMDVFTDRIVAQYIGRMPKAEECYEEALKLLKFYNAKANYENNLKGIYSYFKFKNSLSYLADTPEILKDMDFLKPTANAAKGTRATAPINAWGRQLQVSWLLTTVKKTDDDTEDILNLHKVRSLRYLEECLVWNPDGNYDMVSSMGMLMIYREEKLRQIVDMKKNVKTHSDSWSSSGFFGTVDPAARLAKVKEAFKRPDK